MNLTYTDEGSVRVITVAENRIDAAIAISFKDMIRPLTDAAANRYVVDLAQVDFVDSSGLGAIVAAMKQVPDGKSFELTSLSPNVEKVFRLTRMDTVITIHDSVERAINGDLKDAG